ncbi:MAG: L-serine ammonia-lyase, iron-sulfur-dependent, subunit alpha, partial [Finegoldia magna]
MFDTSLEIINTVKKENRPFYEYVIEIENERTGKSEEFIRSELSHMLDVMEKSATDFLETPSVTNQKMIDGFAHKMHVYANENEPIVGQFTAEAMAMAFSTLEISAAMGKIVASPTAGSSGILPAALMSFKQRYNCSHEELIDAMLVAIGVGQLLGKYATFSGADGGCQAETGSAAAMAAGALIFLRGGSIEQVFHGASFAILHVLGLVCDPIAGLVEYPCTFRNAMGVTNSHCISECTR